MGYSKERAAMESSLAVAHRALARAADAAEAMSDDSAEDDIKGILREVTRVAEDSLKGKAKRRGEMTGQLTL